ncbi:MAG: hypothetical protein HUU02_05345 [Bacteroidetes bacterium]|nr:hypothetical protein [Bacteroidota bacterium]
MHLLFIVSIILLQWMSVRHTGQPEPQDVTLSAYQSHEAVVFTDSHRCKQTGTDPLLGTIRSKEEPRTEQDHCTHLTAAADRIDFLPPIYRHLSIITTSSLL